MQGYGESAQHGVEFDSAADDKRQQQEAAEDGAGDEGGGVSVVGRGRHTQHGSHDGQAQKQPGEFGHGRLPQKTQCSVAGAG